MIVKTIVINLLIVLYFIFQRMEIKKVTFKIELIKKATKHNN